MINKSNILNKLDSIELTKFILATVGKMTHLKLQKLIFYTEAYHLAYFETSLIDDEFQAWMHGPVTRKVWDHLKNYANVNDNIWLNEESDKKTVIERVEATLSEDQRIFFKELLTEFGKKTAYELEWLSHEEDPWLKARKGYHPSERCEVIIDKVFMKEFYKGKLYGSQKG
jgi:uncharacterized phage-associated protein